MKPDLQISVIVPVRDDYATLRTLLAALEAQTFPRELFEVVVGDDGSVDVDSQPLATPDGHVRVLAGPPRNAYVARNRAARSARAPVFAFCDDDCLPEPTWLEAGLNALREADVAGGPIRFQMPPRPTIWTLLDMNTFLDQERVISLGQGLGGNLFMRREFFERVGGFDESLPSGGDRDLVARCVALGARLAFAADVLVSHPSRDRFLPFVRKIWFVSRSHALRELRAGRRPAGLKPRYWIPILPTLASRLRARRPLGLDHARLRENGIDPRLRNDLLALPLLYLLMPYLAGAAHLSVWWHDRSPRGRSGAPTERLTSVGESAPE